MLIYSLLVNIYKFNPLIYRIYKFILPKLPIYIISFSFLFPSGQGSSRWVKVNEKRKLHDVLKEPNFIIPGIPGLYYLYTANLLRHAITITTTYSRHAAVKYKIYVCFCWFIFSFYLYGSVHAVFYVVSKTSRFYNDFKGGKWSPPP